MLIRVQKIIAESGYCSRRRAEELIIDGKVKVNGERIGIGDKADPEKDMVSMGDFVIQPQKKVYIMLNKPKGYITTVSDLYERRKVVDLVKIGVRIFPVGRLDRDATGLLFLTNDGEWANKIMHPRYETEKTYLALLDTAFSKEEKQIIERGIKLHDGFIKAKIKILDKKSIEITLHEGKNKIVKRIFNEVGHRVKELCRVRVGRISLGNLKSGKFRHLEKNEINVFK